ncbi:hypothetical protein GIB67_009571 [Kingdonia uniflora]|uniref:Uncharacterized protein n=1 Tax=Kingdonia uniflora TaxID=39325 RepID=A0A7J7NWK0_9MAGN|nr:hypothetical protein GIB67_009571 [Kingdonia uniflora]
MDIKTAIVDLRKATGWDNLDEIKAKLDPPYKAVLKIGQHMSGGGSDGSVSGGSSQASDQPPEAEYEEVKK